METPMTTGKELSKVVRKLERFTDLVEYERVKNVYVLHNRMLEHSRPNLRVLQTTDRKSVV